MQTENLLELLRNPELFSTETAIEIETVIAKFPWFQLVWMLYAKNLKQIESPQFEDVLKKTAVQVPNRKVLFDFLNKSNPVPTINVQAQSTFSLNDEVPEYDKQGEGNSLIDRFLMSEKKGEGRKPLGDNQSDQDSASDVLEKSTVESDEIITETLANIYFQQKNFNKALHAYQTLSLKYPEKSIYFASRIKEIEDLIPNN